MLTATALSNTGFQAMMSAWKHKPATQPTQQIFQAYADAFSKALVISLRSVVINSGIITGGTSVPGGPVIGATLAFTPGTLVSSGLELEASFVPPVFKGGSYTPWLRAFTACLSSTTKQAYTQWITTWSLPGAVVAGGGVSAWIPPVPPSPPYPGPWSGGTITSPCGFMAPGFGTNASVSFSTLAQTFVSNARAKKVSIPAGKETYVVPIVNTSEGEHLASTIASGLSSIFVSATTSVLVIDKSFLGAGTAVPPTGSIIGGTISNCVLDA
jgi:hypothetical protein